MTPNVRGARTPAGARLALSALAMIASGSCAKAAGGVHSAVAEKPAAYPEEERLDEIDRLDRRIGDEMSRLGLSRAGSATVLISEPGYDARVHDGAGGATVEVDGDEDDAEPGSAPEPAPDVELAVKPSKGGGRSRCERVCDSTRAICDAAEKICRIADSLPGHPTARDRCERARADCTSARSAASGCGCE